MGTARTDLNGSNKVLQLMQDMARHSGVGGLEGILSRHIHGYVSALPNGQTTALWEESTQRLPWRNTAVDDTIELSVASSDANDTLLGSGARTLHAWGWDTGGFYKEIMVNMDGQAEVSIGTDWLFVEHLMVMKAGSGEENAGDIWAGVAGTFTAGVPSNTNKAQLIYRGEGMTHSSVGYVPTGYDGFVMFSAGCTAKSSAANVTFRLRRQNLVLATPELRCRQSLDKYVVTQDMSNRDHPAGFRVPENNFVWQDATASATNMDACTMMDLMCIRKNPDGSSMFTDEDWLTIEEYARQAG